MTLRRPSPDVVATNGGHLAEIRAEEAAIDAVEAANSRLVVVARRTLGLDRSEEASIQPFRAAVQASQAGWFTILALGAFMATDQVLGFLLSVFGPEISGALGLSNAAYGIIVSQRATAAVGVSLQFAAVMHRGGRRRLLVLQAVFATAAGAAISAYASSFWPLFLAVAITGPAAGVVWAAHRPMVMDGYVPDARVRAMSMHQAGIVAGSALAPALVAGLSGWAGLSWRGVFLAVAVVTLVIGVVGLRLRDPEPAVHDTDPVRQAVRAESGLIDGPDGDDVGLRYVETLRRLWLVPTVRRLLAAWAVLGVVIAPMPFYMATLLEDRWRMSVGGRSAFFAVALAFALPALAWFGPRGDAMFGRDPRRLLVVATRLLVVLAAGLVVSVAIPVVAGALVGFGVALAASALLVPALTVVVFSVVRPRARPAAGALIATFLVGVGGQGGAVLLGGVDRRYGAAVAIAILSIPALVAATVVRRAAGTVNDDIDQLLTGVVEEEEIRALTGRGERVPMLACRHLDFFYGQLQVLFDVDFTVDDGEMVALLGTNGAGKSTLLKVVSGIGLPTKGAVRFRGEDITYIDADRRVPLGITQVPGGRAVFGPMDVVENLRTFGYTLGRNRKAVDALIDGCFDAFPRLYERRTSLAANLSGGEQQMLGLSKALILQPQLLLIDELSLGLAPIVVGQLLEMVRRINATGTAVVLVEQSVNIALSLVHHAYFMEKGEMRFDGSAAELLTRGDLLRAVFLEGATKARSTTSAANA